jgi:bacteriocin-like protein
MEEDTDKGKAEDKVTRESEDELSDEELSNVAGGEGPTETISFPYGHIEW